MFAFTKYRGLWRALAGVIASASLLALYARGGDAWVLGFVLLLPWLLALDATRTFTDTLLSGWLMSVAYIVAAFLWFGAALATYTGIGTFSAVLMLCVLAPLLQPQVIVFAVVRHLARRHHHSAWVSGLAGACAWVAVEWLWPKLLGDTLGHGLAPAAWLRQVADLGGAAGISVVLILVNEALAQAVAQRREGLRHLLRPLALALALPLLMAGYGVLRLATLETVLSAPADAMRVAMVQASMVDYEGQRRERGTYAVVRDVLDTHFALSRAAIEHHAADAVLWSETVYPTTFGQPRSEDGAALDREILDFAASANVALVFGTYDRDAAGEYNAATFLAPGSGAIGTYRKTFLFPFTEHVPAWLDGPRLRSWLPWAGSWQPGSGARVMLLRAADGRELNVVPLICRDDVQPGLALDGARLGAQAIVGLSNDSWFTASPLGARLHLAVAAFRSIETRLPQLRVTTNGLSAFVDPTGAVLASTKFGDRAVLAGEVPLRDPPATLMVRWGDWVGAAAGTFLLLLAMASIVRVRRTHSANAKSTAAVAAAATKPASAIVVALLTPGWRIAAALLRVCAGAGLLWLALRMLLRDGLQVNSLVQLQIFIGVTLLPAIAAWGIQRAFAARVRVDGGMLVLQQRHQRIEVPLDRIVDVRVWRIPLPGTGVDLQFASGARFAPGIAIADVEALLRVLNDAESPLLPASAGSARRADYATTRAVAGWPRLDHPLVKFVAFPLLLALPAFRLHQHIAFGGTFGEYYTYGLAAWLTGLLAWWGAWSIGLMMFAAALRSVVEAVHVAMLPWPARARAVRRALTMLSRVAFYLGLPAWLAVRLLAG
ncbi:apolipoprotein N-acyltransferase [Tahibacter aquaticus]|uniref:Apolipoprotein N-acyltransferase n=1 Tax=Tahibacter aquaticus TaxID=520092 RepID=A0A4R6YKS0_9GAMM|nr:apolipoprotein N-acyltransferase [Tahibacter aquaticus]TDR37736.1 apolipoprotein N-acyltransferase [Tahibacter aquaticus]